MFADPVFGSGGSIYRGSKPKSCPTDDQAEVLVPKAIPLDDANHVVAADEAQARRVYVALDLIGAPVDRFRWTIAPVFFQAALSNVLRSGVLPSEHSWTMDSEERPDADS